MGLFRNRSFRKKNKDNNNYHNIDEDENILSESPPSMSLTMSSTNSFSKPSIRHDGRFPSKSTALDNHDNNDNNNSENEDNDDQSSNDEIPSLDDLARFITEIKSCHETYGIKPAKALRSLFALSEDENFHEINRIRMAREAGGKLIPVILEFLQRCEPSSSEQYLALLVLNNISIPKENKRMVAIDHNGAFILARLLCRYPDVPLICIILVNLSFCDASLRKNLVDSLHGEIQLVESLVYALKVGTM